MINLIIQNLIMKNNFKLAVEITNINPNVKNYCIQVFIKSVICILIIIKGIRILFENRSIMNDFQNLEQALPNILNLYDNNCIKAIDELGLTQNISHSKKIINYMYNL